MHNLSPLPLFTPGRSGGTYMMKILLQFDEITIVNFFPYEMRFFLYMLSLANQLHDVAPSSMLNNFVTGQPFNVHVDKLLNDQKEYPHVAEWYRDKFFKNSSDYVIKQVQQFYSSVSIDSGKGEARYFCEKSSPYYHELIDSMYPSFKSIILVRNPINNYVSFKKFFPNHINTEEDAVTWIEGLKNKFSKYRELIHRHEKRVLLLKYEDLITSPLETILSIQKFLGLDISPKKAKEIYLNAQQKDRDKSAKHMTSGSQQQSIQVQTHALEENEYELIVRELGDYCKFFEFDIQ